MIKSLSSKTIFNFKSQGLRICLFTFENLILTSSLVLTFAAGELIIALLILT